jgi:hypothetical protein
MATIINTAAPVEMAYQCVAHLAVAMIEGVSVNTGIWRIIWKTISSAERQWRNAAIPVSKAANGESVTGSAAGVKKPS